MGLLEDYFSDVFSSGLAAGIKSNDAKDMGLIYIPECKAAAGVFTQHALAAPSVHISQSHVRKMLPKVIVVNSGCANACLGDVGDADAKYIVETVSDNLDIKSEEVILAQTGMIGTRLDREVLYKGIRQLVDQVQSGQQNIYDFAEAILTTDTCSKLSVVEYGSKGVVIGVTKGAGMIAPNMATTLSFFITNANICSESLQKHLESAIDKTYNKASVDTDTSTNDMAIIVSTCTEDVDMATFDDSLTNCCFDLMTQLLLDAEGAQKMIIASVEGAESDEAANMMARAIVTSPLIKTMVAGEMLNWGRILMALGKINVKLDLSKITLNIQGQPVFQDGLEVEAVEPDFSDDIIEIHADLDLGVSKAVSYGCDMHESYVTINKDKS